MEVNQVILVDERDQPLGKMEKLEAHENGLLHRAFSIFIFNAKGEMLLQQRAHHKYHSGGLWTNACCSHPAPGEATDAAAHRRLEEELGFDAPLEKIFDFVYRQSFENGLTEHEFDHVYAGYYNGVINPDPAEVMDTCYKTVRAIQEELQSDPERYTAWFRLAFPKMQAWWNRGRKNNEFE